MKTKKLNFDYKYGFSVNNTSGSWIFELSANLGVGIGGAYAQQHTPPANGLIVQGLAGFGTYNPQTTIDAYSATNAIVNIVSGGTANYAGTQITNGQTIYSVAFGSTATGTAFGVNRVGSSFIYTDGGNYFGIGSAGSVPVLFGSNNIESFRIDTSQNVVLASGKNLIVAGELKGARESLNAGHAGPITASTYLRGGHNGITTSSTIGWPAIRAGSIVGMSVAFNTSVAQAGATVTFSWRINGVDAISTSAVSLSATGDKKAYTTLSRNTIGAIFSAGDIISCYATFAGGGTGNAGSILAMGEIVYDN